MQTGLKDRVVIVAASSSGLGRATAEEFAREGAKLAICSRHEHSITEVAGQLRSNYSVEVLPLAVDVTNSEQVREFVRATVRQFGRVDVCVTNAGGPPAKGFLAITDEEWHKAVALNLMSTVYLCREVIPFMQQNRWGRIVTITSLSVKQPIPDLVLSNTVRTGVAGLVRSLANEFGKDGITVNNVAPGYTATESLKEFAAARSKSEKIDEKEVFRGWAKDTAVGRIAEPAEVANAIVWLASEAAAVVTGQTLLVDSGSYKGTF
jgi:3-oxoacyl-[acyl-carrier protein] reductase